MTEQDAAVRPANESDASALAEVGLAAWAGSEFAINDAGRVNRDALLAEFLRFAKTEWQTVRVAEVAGRVVGWGAREFSDQRISDLWVAPVYQGRGLGSLLLRHLEEEVRYSGFRVLELETLATNQGAIRFYERNGFGISSRFSKFTPALGYSIDKVKLAKPLA